MAGKVVGIESSAIDERITHKSVTNYSGHIQAYANTVKNKTDKTVDKKR